MTDQPLIKPREREAIIDALRAGVVPRIGLQHVQVGRAAETREIIRDIDRIVDGGATIRFIIGAYGSGKTFFLNLTRLVALKKGLVVMSADLSQNRRLYGTQGQARMLYAEMAKNVATLTKPLGGAMAGLVERFIQQSRKEAQAQGTSVNQAIRSKLVSLEDLARGYDFATVIERYWEGYQSGDDRLVNAALRWLRAEFSTKTEARHALGVRNIINDSALYDQIKLMAIFVRQAGYKGLLVSLDEMVNIYKLIQGRSRAPNYEQLLTILNDVLQGTAAYLGFVMGGTPEFLGDTRRGVFSYEALKSRLEDNIFAKDGLVDLTGPVIRLKSLTQEDLFVLLTNVRRVMSDRITPLPDKALKAFMEHCFETIGEAYFKTPRQTVRAFVGMLSVLSQNPGTKWQDLVGKVSVDQDPGAGAAAALTRGAKVADEFKNFKLVPGGRA